MSKDKDIEECYILVAKFFGGSPEKAQIWFNTSNPLLGDIEPLKLIMLGREKKLLQFIRNAMIENGMMDEDA